MSDNARYDLVISGAGMVGASLALAAQQAGLRIAVFEKRSAAACAAADPFDRASLIATGSVRFLTSLGVDPALLGSAVERMRVWDAEDSGGIHLDAEEGGEDLLGYIIENRRLEQALHTALEEAGLYIRYGQEITSAAPDGKAMYITDASGTQSRGTLLAIAEGRQSPLRKALIQAPIFRESYGQDAITATVWIEKPHRHIAYQRFLSTGPLAVLPFSDDAHGHARASIVWSAKQARARHLMALDDVRFLRELHEAFGPQLGHFQEIGRRSSYPLSGLHSSRYIGERSVLLGDTAHGVHPLAGLGVNLGFRDAEQLMAAITTARQRHEDWGGDSVLRRYQSVRRPDNLVTVLACGALSHLFSNRSRGLARLRDLGMLGTGVISPVKRFLIRQAMGL
ncbi:FAD-dependent monooxygenase [Acidithiobacillus sp.]|uniref:FAD-dependent monooxygenase n=1 Tax=Acidithiobacillus sp. TaxID=1872118 RepID=UPI002588BBC7|nr:FAD-dependent monooxygenase [Acidithiobacillus sp.]MDD5374421.1 FAD-dependent monooxygenase [Acidithiobacillus sp.]